MPNIHVVIPDSIKGEERVSLKSALASCSFEGQDNPKIQQKIVDFVSSGKPLKDFIKETVEQIKKDHKGYLRQFK